MTYQEMSSDYEVWEAMRSVTKASFAPAAAALRTVRAEAFRLGFNAGRDYELWNDRCSEGDGSIRPNTRNPFDGRDEIDPEGEE